ncbi:hypothetical protein C2G38_150559 [Gigaspora rosea]|uniref:Protein kinase domain-containing protein n=1 Tax=Gigaspora rosea TaxID=44941 RepID=A0A397W874_9GLOM|nr:hypothetical protein C2G38_150559 [Gigaspora rosea]
MKTFQPRICRFKDVIEWIPFDGHCNKDNTQPAWYLSCDPNIETRWTNEHKNINDCMKTFQLRTWRYKDVIEWIPLDRLSEVKKIDEGGFGSVYSATWLNGIR